MSTPEERLDAALGALGSAPPDDALQKLAGAARAEFAAQPRVRAWWLTGSSAMRAGEVTVAIQAGMKRCISPYRLTRLSTLAR